MRSYRKSSHTVHGLKVHLVWITKYRYKVLTRQVGDRLRELIRQSCNGSWADGIGESISGVLVMAAFSSGHVTDEMITEYLKNHENHPNHNDKNFVVE